MKKTNIFNYILMIVLGIILLLVNNKSMHLFNYVFVSIFLLLFVINLLDFKNKDKNVKNTLTILFLWLAIFNYIYYYEVLFQLFLTVTVSIYLLVSNNALKIKNKYINIINILISLLLIVRPGLNLNIYLKIGGIYVILLNIYYIIVSYTKLSEK